MHEHLSKRGKVAATFMAMLLVITFTAALLPEATATPTLTISIHPVSGTVGTEVEVNGTIDTLNGSYTIMWNETLNVTTGYSTGYNVSTSFVIPQTVGAPSGRDVLIELIDNNKTVDKVVNTTFKLYTKYHIKAVVPPPPSQLQEGRTTDIWVNVTGGEANTVYSTNITVTDPSGAVYYTDTFRLTNTTNTGYGEEKIMYPANFSAGAHTNYTGIYNIAFNETLASGNFTVGLTKATEYHRFQVVGIRAAGYTKANESVWVNITFAGESVNGFPKNVSAVGGVIEANWTIPSNASMGLYTVTLTNSTAPSTIKPVLDNQTFTIVKIPFQVQTVKLDGEILAGVKVEVYDATMELVAANITGEGGLASLSVEGGNYSFSASWNIKEIPDIEYVLVGTLLNQTIKRNVTLTLLCWIAYVRIAIDPPLPFIDITLTYHGITNSFETDITGIWKIRGNMPTNISYTIEARRYDSLFNTTHMEKLPATMNASWVNITITCPTYTMFVHVVDSKGIPLKNVEVAVYEWSSGVAEHVQSETTDDLGSADFHLTFGRYKIWVYNEDHTIILNKTVVDLTEDQLFSVVHCKIFNLDLSVIVKDYFGNPISNVLVEVEREGVSISPQKTGSKGTASFYNITGGDCQISVSVMRKIYETRTLYLDETKVMVFKLEKFVVVGGYLLEVTQLITYVSLGIVIALFALALIYRRLSLRKVHEEEEKEKSL